MLSNKSIGSRDFLDFIVDTKLQYVESLFIMDFHSLFSPESKKK